MRKTTILFFLLFGTLLLANCATDFSVETTMTPTFIPKNTTSVTPTTTNTPTTTLTPTEVPTASETAVATLTICQIIESGNTWQLQITADEARTMSEKCGLEFSKNENLYRPSYIFPNGIGVAIIVNGDNVEEELRSIYLDYPNTYPNNTDDFGIDVKYDSETLLFFLYSGEEFQYPSMDGKFLVFSYEQHFGQLYQIHKQ